MVQEGSESSRAPKIVQDKISLVVRALFRLSRKSTGTGNQRYFFSRKHYPIGNSYSGTSRKPFRLSQKPAGKGNHRYFLSQKHYPIGNIYYGTSQNSFRLSQKLAGTGNHRYFLSQKHYPIGNIDYGTSQNPFRLSQKSAGTGGSSLRLGNSSKCGRNYFPDRGNIAVGRGRNCVEPARQSRKKGY